ncbi:MAG: LysR family transcriptional regulator, partial [Caballeronia sp.]
PLNRSALPELPEIEFIALGAANLSPPAATLLQLLQNSDLRGEWAGE